MASPLSPKGRCNRSLRLLNYVLPWYAKIIEDIIFRKFVFFKRNGLHKFECSPFYFELSCVISVNFSCLLLNCHNLLSIIPSDALRATGIELKIRHPWPQEMHWDVSTKRIPLPGRTENPVRAGQNTIFGGSLWMIMFSPSVLVLLSIGTSFSCFRRILWISWISAKILATDTYKATCRSKKSRLESLFVSMRNLSGLGIRQTEARGVFSPCLWW